MVLNIVKNDLPASCIAEYVRCVFDNAKVNIKDENAVSVDIEVTGKNELHSLEGLKELEYYFKYEDSGVIIVNSDLTEQRNILRAEKSIQVYALNRLALVQARREKIIQIKAQIKRTEESIINYNRYAKQSDEEKIWFEGIMRKEIKILKRYKNINQEYSGLAKYIIRKYFEEIYFI